ncbi:MAG TPA: glycoside hydrolase family 130 protein [Actinotalea sp.]
MQQGPAWVRRTDHVLRPDPTRVAARLFLPGQEIAAGESRSTTVMNRVLGLSDDEIRAELDALMAAFSHRHRDLEVIWRDHFALMEHRRSGFAPLSPERELLVGAYFTQEFTLEGSALCNPSMVVHPDQTDLPSGTTRFLMTLRAIGEGHVSSLELRTGTIDADDTIVMDPPPEVAVLASRTPTIYVKTGFEHHLADLGGDHMNSDFVLDCLPPTFGREDLDNALDLLRAQRLTRGAALRTIERFGTIAACTYSVAFPADSSIQERVLTPHAPAESHGIEDVRMLRMDTAEDGTEYVATYTAYDGRAISMQLLRTHDFRSVSATHLTGPGARDKGLALFPRQVGGRYLALSRADRESNALATSTDLLHWEEPVVIQAAEQPWELVQVGNCGPPIETEHGWLVLTHGVGAMRTYGLGAILLDLDDPTIVLGRLRRPFLTATEDERSGYVPNVVYSCGAMLHGRTLVLPYGCSDSATRFALLDLDALLAELGASFARPTS